MSDLNEPFTPEQIDRLRELDEARDSRRERVSRFSQGEQNELDETARNLEFNDIQRKELTHRFRRKLLPIVGYLVLVIGALVAFGHVQAAQQHTCHHMQSVIRELNAQPGAPQLKQLKC